MTNIERELWRAEYPFRSQFLETDGGKIHYLDEGSGEPLVFVHGNPTWSFYWRHLINGLRSKYRCIAIDHLGCGLSDKPQNYEYTLSKRIEHLLQLLNHCRVDSATFLVHDWGGPIGIGSAVAKPEICKRLVVFNTGAFPPEYIPLRIQMCRIPVLGEFGMRRLNLFSKAALTMAVERPRELSAVAKNGLLYPYNSWENRVGVARFVQDIPSSPIHPTWQVLKIIQEGLPKLASLPSCLIWGAKDWCFRLSCLEQFQKAWPKAEAHRLENVGHYVVEEGREEVGKIVSEFLTRTDR